VFDGNCRAEHPTDTTEGALLIVYLERGLGFDGQLTFFPIRPGSFKFGHIPIDGISRAHFLADGTSDALFIVNICHHVICWEALFFHNGETLLAVNLQCQCIKRTQDDADSTVGTFRLIDINGRCV